MYQARRSFPECCYRLKCHSFVAESKSCACLAGWCHNGALHLACSTAQLCSGAPQVCKKGALPVPFLQARAAHAASRLRLTVSGSSACPVPIMERWKALSGTYLLERCVRHTS